MLAALTQNVPTATWERLKPNASRLSPASNGKRMFGKEGLLEFVKIIVKTVLVLVVAGLSLKLAMAAMLAGGLVPASALPATMRDQILRTVSQLAILALVMAVLDGLWVRLKWRKDLMMTRQEVKDEHKQQEGDPMLKQRRLALARQRSNSRMMSDLPKATVVIANPTHYAVAIRYVPSEGGAPKVLAKGADHLALRIRETCEGLQIPVVENKPLARALHDSVTVGEMIPAEFYRAVAEIIHFVEMRKKVQGSSAFR
jgi:flagellar biosynthetic protein FlhB